MLCWVLAIAASQLLSLPPSPPATAQTPRIRAVELVAPESDVVAASIGARTYRSPFAFQAVGLLWASGDLPLQVRTRADAGDWREWLDVAIEDDYPPRSGGAASKLIVVPPSGQAQVRAAPGAPSVIPSSLRVVAIDPGEPLGRHASTASVPPAAGLPAQMAPSGDLAQIPPTPRVLITPSPRPVSPFPPTPTARLPITPTSVIPTGPGPRILSRPEWGADASYLGWTPEYSPVRKFAIHHTVTSDGGGDPAAAIRAIYYYHAVTLGWGDIGYNYLVDRSGNIYEGRSGGFNVVAGHAAQYSHGADGIALLGNYQETRPSDAMMAAVAALIAWRARTQGVDPAASGMFVDKTLPNIFGHRDVMTTDCPGDAAYALLPALRQRVAAVMSGVVFPSSTPVPRPSVSIVSTRFSPTSIGTSDTVQVDITIANTGSTPLLTQGPAPGTVYDELDTYQSVGQPEEYGRIRVGVEVDGGTSLDRRFRWGLGQDLAPGQTRTITGYIRFAEPGSHTLWAGVVQEGVQWLHDQLAQTPVKVWSSGASSHVASTAPSPNLSFPLVMRGNNGWSTRIVVMNTTDGPSRGTGSLRASDGRIVTSVPFSLAASGSTELDLSFVAGLSSPFVGSASIQADGFVAGVAFHERPGFDRMATEPVVSGATRLFAPLVAKGYHGLSTGLQVQNLGSAPTGVNLTYVQDTGATWSESTRLAPSASATFYTPGNTALPPGFVGAAIIESADGQPIAAEVTEVRADGSAMAYAAEPSGYSTAIAPLLYRRRNGWSSALQIQSVGDAPAGVEATYVRANGRGGPWTQRGTVGFGIGATFYLPGQPDLPDDLVASGFVRSLESQPIVALVHAMNPMKKTGTAVGSLPKGGQTLSIPWVTNGVEGWRTGVQVVNLQSQPSPVKLTFTDARGTRALQIDDAISASGSTTYYAPAIAGLPPGFAGSLTIQGRPGSSLTAVVNDVR